MAGSGWQVTGQVTDQVRVTDAGQTQVGTYVYFTTGEGHSGSVFVPDQHYNAKTVHSMIAAKALMLDEVGKLAQK